MMNNCRQRVSTRVIALVTLCVALALLTASCSSSPRVDYYTLQPIAGRVEVAPANARILGLGPLEVPGYLDRPQLVTQTSGGKVNVDEFNRWAEPLAVALPRILTANLDELLDSVVVVGFPYGAQVQPDLRLTGQVIRFDTDQSGEAVLEVQWGVLDDKANSVLTSRRTRYTAQASSARDPEAVVEAMNQTLTAFSRDIASQLSTLLD